MTQPLSSLDLPRLAHARLALFLDFDGTLAEIAEHPGDVVLTDRAAASLAAIADALDGAVAIISGRTVGDIDARIAPLKLPVAGVHGLERRPLNGELVREPGADEAIGQARRALEEFLKRHPRVMLEDKHASLALHYRSCPELEEQVLDAARESTTGHDALQLLRGKMVVEIKPTGKTKGESVASFMQEPAFCDRTPIFAGDDVTDEDGFSEADRRGGISIKVGDGETRAAYRARSTNEFLAWLERLAAVLQE